MANLSTLLGSGSEVSGEVLDPLPTFGVWANYQNNQYIYSVYDSYSQPITSGYYSTGTEQFNNYSAWTRTDSSIGTSSGSTYFGQSCSTVQSEGHYFLNLPALGGSYSAVVKPDNARSSYMPFYGTVVSPRGIRQRISIYANGNTVDLHSFGGGASMGAVNISSQNLLNTSGEPSSTSFGSISYNANTRTLAYVRGDTSNSYRLHIWKNPNIDLNENSATTASLYQFMNEARNGTNGASYFYNNFTWSTSGSSSYNESRHHFRVIMGDNDRIGLVRMTPSNQTVHAWILPNPSSTSLSSGPSTVSTLGLTTSYGIEQGNFFGMRSMNTWDNRTIACYSPYYYYGAGINMHFVDTTDPSRGYTWQNADTSWGWHPFPIGTGEIGVRYAGGNADGGAGLYVAVHSPSAVFTNGRNPGNTASTISNGGQIDPLVTYFACDTGYTSTQYPWIIPMANWTKVG